MEEIEEVLADLRNGAGYDSVEPDGQAEYIRNAIAVSQAISLKRIADALEAINADISGFCYTFEHAISFNEDRGAVRVLKVD